LLPLTKAKYESRVLEFFDFFLAAGVPTFNDVNLSPDPDLVAS
jgi:hypothetical protein